LGNGATQVASSDNGDLFLAHTNAS
jgi:hypothetical protein